MGKVIALEDAERIESASFRAPERGGIFRVSDLDRRPVPDREWMAPGLIPMGTVTLLSGDGGTGKSLLALQLCFSSALSRPWIGCAVNAGRSLYLSAEDDVDELHRRIAAIAASEGVALGELHDLHVMPLAGEDALLAVMDRDSGQMAETDLFTMVEIAIADVRPCLLVVDNLADVYGGNENVRGEARQFINMLRRWAIEYDMAVLVLAHPSLSGLASGSGSSGSTAWSNSVRSRLYLERDKAQNDGAPEDPDARSLKTVKSNYAAIGDVIRLRWQDGLFIAEGQEKSDRFSRAAAQNIADEVFLVLLDRLEGQGRTVSDSTGRGYAPTIFDSEPDNRGINREGFKAVMARLFAGGLIRVEMEGPPSRQRRRIVRCQRTPQ